MKKVGIVGAGHVGGTTALFVVQKGLADVVLLDVVEGLAAGKALDISHAAPVLGIDVGISGTECYEDLAGCSVVVVTAGKPRKPGMTRLDLLKANERIVRSVVEAVRDNVPDCILMMVTNPLDVMTYVAYKTSGFPPERVMGQAGVLDSARFCSFLSAETGAPAGRIEALMLGGHGDTMVPALSQSQVEGKSVRDAVPADVLERLVKRARGAGAEIVQLLKSGSAYYGPAAATAVMVEAVLGDVRSVLPVSAYLRGEYGIDDIYIGVPAELGVSGVRRVVELELEPGEREALARSAGVYREALVELGYCG